MEEKNKEVVAKTTTSLKEINQEFALLTLQQIQQLRKVNINSTRPLLIQEVRQNVETINLNKAFHYQK